MKIAYIKWDDAAHYEGPIAPADLDYRFIVDTVGMLVDETDTHVVVAGDRTYGGRLRDVHIIPRGMILEMRTSDIEDWPKKRKR